MNDSLSNDAISPITEADRNTRNLYKKLNYDIKTGEGKKFKPYVNERIKVRGCLYKYDA